MSIKKSTTGCWVRCETTRLLVIRSTKHSERFRNDGQYGWAVLGQKFLLQLLVCEFAPLPQLLSAPLLKSLIRRLNVKSLARLFPVDL